MIGLYLFIILLIFRFSNTTDNNDLVMTSLGLRPRECVHTPEEKNHLIISTDKGVWIKYLDSGRQVFHEEIPKCVENAKYLKQQMKRKSKALNFTQGWQIYGSAFLSDYMGKFSSVYQVPESSPTADDGQILYYFIGLQDDSDDNLTIIQPVVAYCPNGCGWSYSAGWSGAAWNCCPNGQSWYGSGVPLANGAIVSNYVEANDKTGLITVYLENNGQISQLNLQYDYRQYNWACVTLEAYDMQQCQDFNQNAFIFQNMQLTLLNGTTQQPTWETSNNLEECQGSINYFNDDTQANVQGTA